MTPRPFAEENATTDSKRLKLANGPSHADRGESGASAPTSRHYPS
ncbi:hypothetical protein HMPREF0185_02078 [Brevundimonas diminuta 470-4]|nr:hypothetical protein HMPREF0185_02078 [Brevundimonas diminuta 470-4]